MPDKTAEQLWIKYDVPEHVILHMKAVADFQEELLRRIDPDADTYDAALLKRAALLHDVARLRKDHALAGAQILDAEGLPAEAALVREHHSPERNYACAPDTESGQDTGRLYPEDILFYADKRVQEDRIVSLEERFSASAGKCRTEEAVRKHEKLFQKAKWIEKMIYG